MVAKLANPGNSSGVIKLLESQLRIVGLVVCDAATATCRRTPPVSWPSSAVLPITVDDETITRAWADTLHLARAHNLSAYDAAYLELRSARGLPLATLDDRLKAAAAAVGVPLFEIQ